MTSPPGGWIYYKIYPGAAADNFDQLVLGISDQLVALPQIIRWFYLHYTDEAGPHLRLRLQTSVPIDSLRPTFDHLLDVVLAELVRAPASAYRPVVIPPAPTPVSTPLPSLSGSGIRVEEYMPDIESFGAEGVLVAEELFARSSATAVHILIGETRGEYSRKTVVPLVMQAAVTAFLPDDPGSVWTDYAAYWLSWHPKLRQEWLPRFDAKADQLRANGITVLTPDAELPAGALDALVSWRAATRAAAASFAAARDEPRRPPRDLAFHCLHTMNNRLGLMPIEEAYFSTLIAHEIVRW